MTTTIYISRDATAVALGANATAAAIAREAAARNIDVTIVRNGSRGAFFLEPLVEVVVGGARIAYGPVKHDEVASLFDADFLEGKLHVLQLGPVDEIPFLKNQERLTFERVGITDPVSLEDYRAHGGYRGLEKALGMSGAEIVKEVTDSGLRGRGGAAFPAGIKWKTVLDASPVDMAIPAISRVAQKYIVCNADEGDSGTYSDRMLMEGDPFCLIEGMTTAGIAVGATQGYIYLRAEYPHAQSRAQRSDRRGVCGRLARCRRARQRQALRSRSAPRRRRVHLRRGNLACWKASKASADRSASSRRCRR